jgi:hypothetical protein
MVNAKRGNVAFLQSAQEFGSVQSLEIDDAGTVEQRQEEIRHLGEDVKHRENAEQRVLGADLDDRKDRVCLANEIGMCEHDALGIGGGAGSIEKRGEVVVLGHDGLEIGGAGGVDGIEIISPIGCGNLGRH